MGNKNPLFTGQIGNSSGVSIHGISPTKRESQWEEWYGWNHRMKTREKLTEWFTDNLDKKIFEALTGTTEEKNGKY